MQTLTPKEEEVMEYIWQLGRAAPKDVRALYDDPKPHVNTVATSFHALERKGFLRHEAHGRSFIYFPLIDAQTYGSMKFKSLISTYYNGSYKQFISALIKDQNVNKDELKAFVTNLQKKENR